MHELSYISKHSYIVLLLSFDFFIQIFLTMFIIEFFEILDKKIDKN